MLAFLTDRTGAPRRRRTTTGKFPTLVLLVAGSVLAAPALPTAAQDAPAPPEAPQVLSKLVAVGSQEARLTLELSSGESVELALSGGQVRMDGEVLGSYTPGEALYASWRELVAASLDLEDDALLQALVDWEPPVELSGDALETAERMDRFLATRFDTAAIRARAEAQAEARDAMLSRQMQGVEGLELLSRLDRLQGLTEALADLENADPRLVVDDHLEVPAGTELRSALLIVDGTLEVEGTIYGDVMVVDGEVELLPGSRIAGTLTLANAELDDEGGSVDGGIRRLDRAVAPPAVDETQLRNEIMRELRRELRMDLDDFPGGNSGFMAPVRRVFGGIGDIIGEIFKILILGGIGALFLHFAGPNMDAVADVARRSPGRAALVGLAGGALVLPIWILGIIALAITIIGIPAILLWVPLFPAAVLVAGLMGYLAVAGNVGTWLSRQGYAWAEWVRVNQPATLIFGGLVVFAIPFVGAELLGMVGFLDVLAVLLAVSGGAMVFFAAAVGFGAVLLSRAGRKPEDWGAEMFTRPFQNTSWGRRYGWGDDEDVVDADPEADAFDAELDPDAREPGRGAGGRGPGTTGQGAPDHDDDGMGHDEDDDGTGHDEEDDGTGHDEEDR